MHARSRSLGTECLVRRILSLGLLSALCLCAGCDRRRPVGGGFELRQAQNWNPDGHPGVRLYFRGRQVWRSVTWGDGGPAKNVHGDIFVFEAMVSFEDNSLPLELGGTNAPVSKSPGTYGSQLFAVKGAGPPVLISPRIFSENGGGRGDYEVVRSGATDSMITVVFRYWVDENHDSERTNSVPWQSISKWLAEAEKTGKLQKSPEGDYRVLTP